MGNTAYDRQLAVLQKDVQQGILKFAAIEGAVIMLVLLPGLLRLFVYNDGIAPDRAQTYLIALIVGYAIVSGLLTWKFVLGPLQRLNAFRTERKP